MRGAPPVFTTIYQSRHVKRMDFDTSPLCPYVKDGAATRSLRDFIAGCDGQQARRASVREQPSGLSSGSIRSAWLGLLSKGRRRLSHELIIPTTNERGSRWPPCARCNPQTLLVQCPLDDHVDQWPDQRFWDELKRGWNGRRSTTWSPGPRSKRASRRWQFVAETDAVRPDGLAGDAAHKRASDGAKA